jgi:hypothetical protein
MKSSSLAQRLEEFEATIESLRLSGEPTTRRIAPQDVSPSAPIKAPRRRMRAGGIQIRDQGLRAFRVR